MTARFLQICAAVILFTGMVSAGAWAQGSAAAPQPVQARQAPPPYYALLLSGRAPEYAIVPHIYVFEDAEKALTFRQVLAQFRQGKGRA